MRPRFPIGVSDFRKLREAGLYYVDKTGLVADILEDSAEALLLPRPRRFGKTLNLSMLRYFFERTEEDRSPLFRDLAVWRSDAARAHFGRHPVIYLSFKDVKERTWEDARASIRRVLRDAVDPHVAALSGGGARVTEWLAAIQRLEGDDTLYSALLRELSAHLARAHGERVVILVDEYDIPIQAGYSFGYYDDVTLFFRNFLSGGLKDNASLFKGILTGVLRAGCENKDSIFSGLNNVAVSSILDPTYASAFGFTETEVRQIAADLGTPDLAAELARWYDGYDFAGTTIYNPWSVLNYAKTPQKGFQPYWVFTAADDVLRDLVLRRRAAVAPDFETLLSGGAVARTVTEHVVLRDLDRDPDAVWNLLLLSGYLTPRSVRLIEGEYHAELVIPNVELRHVFRKSVQSVLKDGLGGSDTVRSFYDALLAGDEVVVTELLDQLVTRPWPGPSSSTASA